METEKKVSVISPCYNGEAFADRFLNNILEQSYMNIELIFVDDGSTDRTYEIANSYKEKFSRQGRDLICIRQDNLGQAEAINKGLVIFSGDYLMWTDSDDILDKNNIKKKVEFLEQHKECGFVMCQGHASHENSLNKKLWDLIRVQPIGEDKFFEDMILEKNVVFTPGVYMVRREAFLDAIPKRHILPSRLGQNWQMLLPLSYKYKCGYIKEDLFTYVIREDSHSRRAKTLKEVIDKLRAHNDLLESILESMGLAGSNYKQLLNEKLIRKEFDNAYQFGNKTLMKDKYKELKEMDAATNRDTLILWSGLYPFINSIYVTFKKSKKTLTRFMAKV